MSEAQELVDFLEPGDSPTVSEFRAPDVGERVGLPSTTS